MNAREYPMMTTIVTTHSCDGNLKCLVTPTNHKQLFANRPGAIRRIYAANTLRSACIYGFEFNCELLGAMVGVNLRDSHQYKSTKLFSMEMPTLLNSDIDNGD